jgi:hypothetical protein
MRAKPVGELGGVILTLGLLGALFAVLLFVASGPVPALAFLAALTLAIVAVAWAGLRRGERAAPAAAVAAQPAEPSDGVSRLLVVADPDCRSEALADEVQRVAAGRHAEVYVIAPAPQGRLDETLAFLAAAGVTARASIGDGDALRATDDGLACFSAGEIVYVTRPGSTWLDGEVVALAERRYDQRVRSIVLEP